MARVLHRLAMFLVLTAQPCLAAPGDAPSRRTFNSNGVKIRYDIAGSGEPVVLIHGLDSSAGMNWELPGIFGMLAKDHQVIALDLRGHGGSDRPENEDAYGLELVEDVKRLLDHLGIQKAHIVGYSLGGMVAVKFLTKHPERVRSAVIGGMGWLREGSALQKFWDQMPAHKTGRTPPALIHSVSKLAVTRAELAAIRVPVIVLIGDKDPVKPLYVTPLRRVRDDWPVIEIPEAGHITCLLKPQFRDEIHAWLVKHIER